MQIDSIGRLTRLLMAVAIAVGLATSALPQAKPVEPAAAELPFARSRDGIRETYIVSSRISCARALEPGAGDSRIGRGAIGGAARPSLLRRQAMLAHQPSHPLAVHE